jgi:hypothetical protein
MDMRRTKNYECLEMCGTGVQYPRLLMSVCA